MSPTELKMQPTIHFQKAEYFSFNVQLFLEMYCGLHFQFHRRAREIPCIIIITK
jgi:hypothetical protein